MAWNPNIPLPGEAKSVSQGQILDNFTYLNDLVLGVNNFIKLPVQGAAPATTATQMALYTKTVGAAPAMFLRNHTSGTEVNFTTAEKAQAGYCVLPCGIKMYWNYITINNGATNHNYATTGGFPAFAAVYTVSVVPVFGANLQYSINVTNLSATTLSLYTQNAALTGYILVIGS
jgi:hypothetical protein